MAHMLGVPVAKKNGIRTLLDEASARHGVVSRAQAQELVSRRVLDRLIEEGALRRLRHGVYATAGSRDTWEQRLWAAYLWAGAEAVVAGRSAARIWKLGSSEVLEINAPKRLAASDIQAHQWILRGIDVTHRHGMKVTTVERCLVDLAHLEGPNRFEEALDRALYLQRTAIPRLHRTIDQLAKPGRRGISMFREMVELRDRSLAPHQSVLETRLARLLRRDRLPQPITQYIVREGTNHIATLDFAYPALSLAIETDGYEWHGGHARWKRDLIRRNTLTNLGWRVIHLTWWDVTRNGDEAVRVIREAIQRPLFRI